MGISEETIVRVLSVSALSILALLIWLIEGPRKLKSFVHGSVCVAACFAFLFALEFVDHLHPLWLQLVVLFPVLFLILVLCFALWTWLERKIDPLRPQREATEKARIRRNYIEHERRSKELEAEIAELNREFDEIDPFLDQATTDEELERLIDINAADEKEPSGISHQRREKLIRDTEERIRMWPPIKFKLAKAHQQDARVRIEDSPLTDDEISIAEACASQDFIVEYMVNRRAALLRGASAKEIDTLTEEWAEYHEVDVDALDYDWVGALPLKLKKIRRMDNEAEKEAAIEALALEEVLKTEKDTGSGRERPTSQQ
ncbi:MAG: hypothetical protein JW720_01740 [Sedimentisphaerales bacterium]|nr:hypothetical protein [Sedimentisphaerales bacterium]